MVILTGKLATTAQSEPRLRLTSYELRRLRHIAGDPKSDPSHVTAAKSVLRGAQGENNEQTAFALGVPVDTVRDLQHRFAKCRFAGLGVAAERATGSAIHVQLTGSESLSELVKLLKALGRFGYPPRPPPRPPEPLEPDIDHYGPAPDECPQIPEHWDDTSQLLDRAGPGLPPSR
ncbi:MAG: hypothetical protein AMXMBFR33_50390 [Candidatus Xenobia bacterium]